MSLELTSDEAKALKLGHGWGLIERTEIAQIADELIAGHQRIPSSEICELALCTRDFQVEEALSKFFADTEKWNPLIVLLTKYLPLDQLVEVDRVSLYYSISNYIDWDDPEPWRAFKILCHEFSDARIGVYGDEEEISKELFEILSNVVSAH